MTGDSVVEGASAAIISKVNAWRDIKMQIVGLEAAKQQIEEEITLFTEATGVDTKPVGMNKVVRTGGFDKAIIPMLKKMGIRSAIKPSESVVAVEVVAAIATGELTEEDVAAFRKPDSVSYRLCAIGEGE